MFNKRTVRFTVLTVRCGRSREASTCHVSVSRSEGESTTNERFGDTRRLGEGTNQLHAKKRINMDGEITDPENFLTAVISVRRMAQVGVMMR